MAGEAGGNTTSGQVNLPNQGQVTTAEESPEEKSGAMQSWLKTADTAKPQAESMPAGAAAPQPPVQVPKTVPVPVTSLKPGGIKGLMDSMLDVFAGTQRPELGKDPDGNLYVKQHTMTRGQQWMKIAGEAMTGAAAGLAAGKGAGNMGKAPLAGMQAQQQAADKQTDQMRQAVLDNANNQMLRMKIAEQTWRNTRLQTEATEHDIEFAQGQEDRLVKAHATLLGTVAHPGDITGVQKANPDLMKDLVKNHALEFVPHYTDGKPDGFKVYKTEQGYRDTLIPPGAEFPTFNSVTGEYQWHKTTDTETQGALDDYWTAAGATAQKFKADQKEMEVKGATQKNLESETTARDKELPGKMRQTTAETRRANAAADLDEEKKKQVKAGMVNEDGTPNPRFELMANSIVDGDLLPTDLKREAKGAGLDPNQLVGRAMEIAQAKGQTLSLPILEQEHKFASNVKTQAALDGIDRVLGPTGSVGPLDQMLNLARAANLGPVGFANSIALGVRNKFGDTAAKNLNTSISDTRRTIAGLIGNPLLGGSETDKKLEQAVDMLGGSPTMANLEGAADILKTALGTQKASIIGNNRYLRKRYGGAAAPAAAAPAAPAAAPAATPSFSKSAWQRANPNGDVNAAVQEAQRQKIPVID